MGRRGRGDCMARRPDDRFSCRGGERSCPACAARTSSVQRGGAVVGRMPRRLAGRVEPVEHRGRPCDDAATPRVPRLARKTLPRNWTPCTPCLPSCARRRRRRPIWPSWFSRSAEPALRRKRRKPSAGPSRATSAPTCWRRKPTCRAASTPCCAICGACTRDSKSSTPRSSSCGAARGSINSFEPADVDLPPADMARRLIARLARRSGIGRHRANRPAIAGRHALAAVALGSRGSAGRRRFRHQQPRSLGSLAAERVGARRSHAGGSDCAERGVVSAARGAAAIVRRSTARC